MWSLYHTLLISVFPPGWKVLSVDIQWKGGLGDQMDRANHGLTSPPSKETVTGGFWFHPGDALAWKFPPRSHVNLEPPWWLDSLGCGLWHSLKPKSFPLWGSQGRASRPTLCIQSPRPRLAREEPRSAAIHAPFPRTFLRRNFGWTDLLLLYSRWSHILVRSKKDQFNFIQVDHGKENKI